MPKQAREVVKSRSVHTQISLLPSANLLSAMFRQLQAGKSKPGYSVQYSWQQFADSNLLTFCLHLAIKTILKIKHEDLFRYTCIHITVATTGYRTRYLII